MLDEAAALLGVGQPADARAVLEAIDEDIYPPPQKARYGLLLARATYQTGEPWAAFLILRRFPDEFPHSEDRLEVEELVFDIGREMSGSDKTFFIFSSDRADAQQILTHLIQRYPRTTHLADALQILGELAFEDEDFLTAHARFKDLLQQQPDSEWAPLARFRIAMSEFRVLEGPEYDLEQMQRARNELEGFLANPPESPSFVSEARAALQVVVSWMAERHLLIADFYKTIDNPVGELHHLQVASRDFADTDSGKIAAERLAALAAKSDGRRNR
jgi:outer membrane protein assembly factor BamD (BamD/ComL family)